MIRPFSVIRFIPVSVCDSFELVSKSVAAFQLASWDSPGWDYAKEVVTVIASTAEPEKLECGVKIRLLELSMKAATESSDWLEFFVAVTDELTNGKQSETREEHGNKPPLFWEEQPRQVEQESEEDETT